MLTKILTTFSCIFFPSYCYVCKKEGASLCTICLSKRKLAESTPSPCIISTYSFKDPVIKKIIHAIKYFHRKDLIPPLAEALAKEISSIESNQQKILVPIPMPTIRKYIRGHNHAESITKIIAEKTNIPFDTEILQRTTSKKRQVTTHSRSERLQNQHNAFTVHKNVKNLHIILIDDVTTTGATIFEARRVLLKKGAASVSAATLAH